MDTERVNNTLNIIGKVYENILDESWRIVLPSAQSTVTSSRRDYDYAVQNSPRGFVPKPWGYTIPHEQPLQFRPKQVPHGLVLKVDVYCDIGWLEADFPVKQEIKVRVWCKDESVVFREDFDAVKIEDSLTAGDRSHFGRVMSRMSVIL